MSRVIKRIGISNFKSFANYTPIDLGDITILSGLNSSGKSSIYQIFFLLAQSFDNYLYGNDVDEISKVPTLNLNGEIIKLGLGLELLNDQNKNSFQVNFEWEDGAKAGFSFGIMKRKKYEKKISFVIDASHFETKEGLGYSAKREGYNWKIEANAILRFTNPAVPQKATEHIEQNLRSSCREDLIREDKHYWKQEVHFSEINSVGFQNFYLERFSVPLDQIVNCLKDEYISYIEAERLGNEISNIIGRNDVFFLANEIFSFCSKHILGPDNITYLPPFRGFPKRVYSYSDSNKIDAVKFNANDDVDYYFDNKENSTKTGTLKDAVNFWIVDHFNFAEEVIINEPIPDLASEIFLRRGEKLIPINNVGFGTSQIIPVIFEILANHNNKLFFIDEPEIHLHPSAQSKLADFFLNMALIGKRIFVETHSEYLIDKFIYLNMLNNVPAPKINMLWAKLKDNQTIMEKIEYDEFGFIINAPNGFLSEKADLVEKLNQIRFAKMSDQNA